VLKRKSDIERFHQYAEPITESGCWIWTASENGKGYGQFSVKGIPVKAHVFAYEFYRGAMPIGLMPDHLCRVRCCVNPWHMEAVPNKINVLRGDSPTAINARKTSCIRGHVFDQANTYTYKSRRYCKSCQRDNWPKYHWAFIVERREE
jgi:hypothetical protein